MKMPDYPIPKRIPVWALNRADLDATVAEIILSHQQQIRTAVSETDKFNDPLKYEVTTLEEPIDEFHRHDLIDEYRLLDRMKNGEHRMSTHQDEAAGSWTVFGYFGAMMDEVDRKKTLTTINGSGYYFAKDPHGNEPP
jgi:hypothetical protein